MLENIFHRRTNTYNLRSQPDLKIPSINTTYKGINSLRYYGATIWNSLPENWRNIETLGEFKSKIKKWKPDLCKCRLCKTYIDGVGFV